MSSKVRKPGQSRPSSRGKGNRQSSSQNFGRLQKDHSPSLAACTQELSANEYGNVDITSSILQLIGCHVLVYTEDNKIYDGVLYTISPAYVICLKNAHLQSDGNHKPQEQCNAPNKEELIANISFDLKQIICIKCKNVDLDYARKDSLATDSMISGCNGPTMTERKLEPWKPEDDSHAVGALEEMTEFTNGVAYDVVRRANEQKFEYKTSFGSTTMSNYQDDIETSDKELFNLRQKKAEQVAAEIAMESTHRCHEQLDSGQSEEDKFSAVRRTGSNSNRYSNTVPRGGRGRSRGSGPLGNYRDPSNEHVTNLDGRNNRSTVTTANKKTSDEPAGPKRLYSDFFNQSGAQSEVLNQQGQVNNNLSQPNRMNYQSSTQQQQRQKSHNELHQAGFNQQQKLSHHGGTTSHHQPNLPPRMQHQKAAAAASVVATSAVDGNQTHYGMTRGQNEVQTMTGSPSPTRPDHRTASFDNEKEKQTSTTQRNQGVKQGADVQSLEQRSLNDTSKSSADVTKHKEDLFKDTRGVPRQKFGKVQQQQEEKAPNINELKSFSEKFKLDQKTSRRLKDSVDSNKAQQNESEKQDQESIIIHVSPDKAGSPHVASDQIETTKPVDIAAKEQQGDITRVEDVNPTKTNMAVQSEKMTELSSDNVKCENDSTVDNAGASSKKGLNPNAKEFKLNPNAKEYIPLSPPSATSTVTQRVQSPTATQQFHTMRLVTASSPPIQGTMAANAITQGQRFNVNPYDQRVESPSVSSPAFYPANVIQHQGQPQQQHMQPQQQAPLFLLVNRPPQYVVNLCQQSNVMGHAMQTHQQPRISHPAQVFSPYHDSSQGVYIANQPGNPMMTHQQQQQQQQSIHGPQISYSHSSTPSGQQQVPHYMVQNQPYQMASAMQSTAQGSQMAHALQRPPTPQHAVQSATPPMHPAGPSLFIGNNQMASVNMHPHSSLVASPHVPVRMQTFPGVS